MPTDLTPPDATIVIDLIEAFRRSKTMFAAVSLGIFDALSGNASSAGDLSSKLNCDPRSLSRLLDACVGLGLLSRQGERYANTPAADAYLCESSSRRLTGYINFSNEVSWELWSHLEDSIRSGSHAWQSAFGWEGPIFDHLFRTPEARREFLMGMHGFGLMSSPNVVAAFDLSRFTRLVDLGGATGHLAVAACRHYPALRATLFDLPGAVPVAQEYIASTEVADRVETVSGDFFTDPLPSADLFAVGRILHDWTDEKCDRLLKRIAQALPQGGAVLIAEKMIWDDRTGPVRALMQDLNMLACTEGHERTLNGYEGLLSKAGFGNVLGVRTKGPVDAILAEKL